MVVLVTCKNEEDLIKTRVLTTSNIDFSDAQGQLTLQSMVRFGRLSNSSVLLLLSLLPTRMKKIRSPL